MAIKYRQLSPSGDYVFGQGNQEFYYDVEAVGQAIKTRLDLLLGTFWRDLNDGLPLFQKILPSSGSPANLLTVDSIIQKRIAETQDVTAITFFQSVFNGDTRRADFETTVETLYSTLSIQDTL